VPPGDDSFTDVERWRCYNTNNLWIDLEALRALQAAGPRRPRAAAHRQPQDGRPVGRRQHAGRAARDAMGAAIGSIEGARAVQVPRHRFAPVKTTDDLLVVRSDCYELTPEGLMLARFDGPPPFVALDKDHYKLLPGFEARFPSGAPSLRRCSSLTVTGDVVFGAGVVVEGEVVVTGPGRVADGEVLRG
jgi:UTP--glucose-1-phosphate uridylyltransferase